ncbi:MAG: hypothetical protein ABJF88_05640 [Rhodothermales bacterium]
MRRSLTTLQSLALSLMLFGLAVQISAGALIATDSPPKASPVEHVDGDGHPDHGHPSTPLTATLVDVHRASIGGDVLDALAAFFGGIVEVLRGTYICGDCNLPSDDGCQCVCWSGNPRPGDCD